jgi:hypothetical protein
MPGSMENAVKGDDNPPKTSNPEIEEEVIFLMVSAVFFSVFKLFFLHQVLAFLKSGFARVFVFSLFLSRLKQPASSKIPAKARQRKSFVVYVCSLINSVV